MSVTCPTVASVIRVRLHVLGVGAVCQTSPTSSMVRMYPFWTFQRRIDAVPDTGNFLAPRRVYGSGPPRIRFPLRSMPRTSPRVAVTNAFQGQTQENRRREVFLKNGGSCGTGRTMRRLSRANGTNLGTGFGPRLRTTIQLRMKSPLCVTCLVSFDLGSTDKCGGCPESDF